MKTKDKQLLATKTAPELMTLIGETEHEMVNARMSISTRQNKDTNLFRRLRAKLAILKTLLHQKSIA